MPDPEDILDLSSSRTGPGAAGASGGEGAARAYLRLYFRCANVYTRAYPNAQRDAYNARCPKCGKTVRFAVGPGGTSERFFEVRCR